MASIDLSKLEELGYECGLAVCAFMRGFYDGIDDAALYKETEAVEDVETPAADEQADKEEAGADCVRCWCDLCANIDDCPIMPAEWHGDGLTPFPCAECVEGHRFKDREVGICESFKLAAVPNHG